jgi:hypothetical protein
MTCDGTLGGAVSAANAIAADEFNHAVIWKP